MSYQEFRSELSADPISIQQLSNLGSKLHILLVYSWFCPVCIRHRNVFNRLKLLHDKAPKQFPDVHWIIGLPEKAGPQAHGIALEKMGIMPDFFPSFYLTNGKQHYKVPDEILNDMVATSRSNDFLALKPLLEYLKKIEKTQFQFKQ